MIESPNMLYKALPHIAQSSRMYTEPPHIIQGIHIFLEAHRTPQVNIVGSSRTNSPRVSCFVSFLRDFRAEMRKSNADRTNGAPRDRGFIERHPRPWSDNELTKAGTF